MNVIYDWNSNSLAMRSQSSTLATTPCGLSPLQTFYDFADIVENMSHDRTRVFPTNPLIHHLPISIAKVNTWDFDCSKATHRIEHWQLKSNFSTIKQQWFIQSPQVYYKRFIIASFTFLFISQTDNFLLSKQIHILMHGKQHIKPRKGTIPFQYWIFCFIKVVVYKSYLLFISIDFTLFYQMADVTEKAINCHFSFLHDIASVDKQVTSMFI